MLLDSTVVLETEFFAVSKPVTCDGTVLLMTYRNSSGHQKRG